jgi:hypothetical protein
MAVFVAAEATFSTGSVFVVDGGASDPVASSPPVLLRSTSGVPRHRGLAVARFAVRVAMPPRRWLRRAVLGRFSTCEVLRTPGRGASRCEDRRRVFRAVSLLRVLSSVIWRMPLRGASVSWSGACWPTTPVSPSRTSRAGSNLAHVTCATDLDRLLPGACDP